MKLRRDGHSKKVQNPYSSADCKRRGAHTEEAQVFVHDLDQFVTGGTTRRNARCPIARQALQRRRTLI